MFTTVLEVYFLDYLKVFGQHVVSFVEGTLPKRENPKAKAAKAKVAKARGQRQNAPTREAAGEKRPSATAKPKAKPCANRHLECFLCPCRMLSPHATTCN